MQTGSSDYFSGVGQRLTDLALDFARVKLIDVESSSDDRNIRDRVDARTGTQAVPQTAVPWGLIVASAAVVLLGVFVAKRVL